MFSRRRVAIGLFSFLTANTCVAAHWQYSRYQQSLLKFQRISQAIKNNTPQQLTSEMLKQQASINEFRFVKVQNAQMQECMLVNRFEKGQVGFSVVLKCLFQGSYLLVDMGWIPASGQAQFQQYTFRGPLKGFLRKAEKQQNQQFANAVDPSLVTNSWKTVYLQRVQEGQRKWPLPKRQSEVSPPYLTPDKHLGYSLFWSSCSLIGVLCIGILLRKK